MAESTPKLAYISRAALFLVGPDGTPERVESRFGEDARARSRRLAARDAWKQEGGGGMLSGGALWGGMPADPEALRIAIRGLGRGRQPGELLYTLDTGDVTGVFKLDAGEEQRLFHSNQHRVDFLAAHPEVDQIACSVAGEDGSAHLAVMASDGSEIRAVTEGDSVDEAPSWVPGRERTLVYQSAGVGRNGDGYRMALGPFSIEQLDLESGELKTRAEDPRHDLLSPRVAPDGALHFLRRPYEPAAGRSHWQALGDFLMMPFRILYAIFQWLNVFTAMYTGRKLTSAGGPERDGPDVKWMFIWGNLIEAAKAERRGRLRGDDAPALVPKTWELVRSDPSGASEVLARGVLGFDIARDGTVLYTNGSAVERLAPGGSPERICTGQRIEGVVALD